MITEKIKICGQDVVLAYCYATEIAYRELANEDILDWAKETIDKIQAKEDPDIKRSIFAILACLMAYYRDADKTPIHDTDILHEATPNEIITAVLAILRLRGKFYYVPSGEPEDNSTSEDNEKNA